MSAERKVPRVDWAKYRGGRAAGRRETVTVLGDSLRELGCVRVQGYAEAGAAGVEGGGEGGGAAVAAPGEVLRALGRELLAAVGEYFGLAAAELCGAAAEDLEPAPGGEADVPGLLLLVPAVPPGLAVRRGDGDWLGVAANPGELLVVPGSVLARLTADRVPPVALRWPGAPDGWLVPARPGVTAAPLPAFLGA